MKHQYRVHHKHDRKSPLYVGVVGQNVAGRPRRATIVPAIEHAATCLGLAVELQWFEDAQLNNAVVNRFDALFVAPGAATDPMQNILTAIQVARTEGVPCLGTCGGFQRMATEFAYTVLGYEQVHHAEASPEADNPLFAGLACQITGVTGNVLIKRDSAVGRCYETTLGDLGGSVSESSTIEVTETFYCRFGMNPTHVPAFEAAGVEVVGQDADGTARIIALRDHPFFVGTLFVPQVLSTPTQAHPLVMGLLLAAAQRKAV